MVSFVALETWFDLPKLSLCLFQITVSPEKLLPRDTDEDLGGGHVDDMTKLTYLNDQTDMHWMRYM